MQEYIQSVLDRQFHYMDQILHKDGLSAYEAEFTENWFSDLTPEGAFESAKSQRDDFIARPYNPEYPFVLRHGDMHGRNVIVRHVRTAFSLKLIASDQITDVQPFFSPPYTRNPRLGLWWFSRTPIR